MTLPVENEQGRRPPAVRCFCGSIFLALCVYFSTGCSGEGVEQKAARDRAAQVQQEIQTLKQLDTPQLEHDVQTQLKRLDMPKKKFATGRFENHIIIDTNGVRPPRSSTASQQLEINQSPGVLIWIGGIGSSDHLR